MIVRIASAANTQKTLTNGDLLLGILIVALIAAGFWLLTRDAEAAVTNQNNCWVGTSANETVEDIPHLGCLRGLGGIDRLLGYDGNDKLDGQTGNKVKQSDDLHGGTGFDTFYVGPGEWLSTANVWNYVAWIHDYENNEVICSQLMFGSWYIKVLNGSWRFVVARTPGGDTVVARIVNWGTGKTVSVRPLCKP
jgi:Ca2+-binding RTX toxin-like protein